MLELRILDAWVARQTEVRLGNEQESGYVWEGKQVLDLDVVQNQMGYAINRSQSGLGHLRRCCLQTRTRVERTPVRVHAELAAAELGAALDNAISAVRRHTAGEHSHSCTDRLLDNQSHSLD